MTKGLPSASSSSSSSSSLKMGRKLDTLLGKRSNQLRPVLNLALSRLVVLKNQRQARCSLSRSDVVQLLTLGQHDRALLRVEQVIKDENLMDVYVMLDGYCFLILERIHLIEQHEIRECPEEVSEAVSSLIYAASRCGEFPELQEIRAIFTHRYGKEFAARAIELRNNCSVNRQMIIKLSPRQPDLKTRLKMLNEIAAENKIVLHIQDITSSSSSIDHDQVTMYQKSNSKEETKPGGQNLEEELTDSMAMKRGRQYKDVADAAQAAFESAAYAAAAARAAVELSKPQSHHHRQNPRDDVIEIQPSPEEEEEMVETTTKTTTTKEEDEGEGLQKNGSNLEEEEVKEKSDDKEDPVERTSQSCSNSSENPSAANAKPETNRFFAWTRRRKLWRSRPGEEQ